MEIAKNQKIKRILNDSFLYHYKLVQGFTLSKFINDYITEWDNHYKSIGIKSYKSDSEVKELLGFAKNKTLNESFINVKEININEDIVAKNFENQINKALILYSNIVNLNDDKEFQSIFIEDDFLPVGLMCLYGKGNFEILQESEYLNFDYNNQLLHENCKIDYLPVMKNLVDFNQTIEEFGFDNYVSDSEFYDSLSKMYRYKTYLLLNLAFEKIDLNFLKNLRIQKPFYVFANEHDCEVSNIYIFD